MAVATVLRLMDSLLHMLDLDRFVSGDLLVIATLIILESLLSCDNAVALAMLVRKLPAHQQGRALRYGIVGAYVFLIIALCLATWIVSQWWLKLLGGGYLLWIAGRHFLAKPPAPEQPSAQASGSGGWRIPGLSMFWATVVSVELTDIAFSVDSLAAAVAFSDKFFVLLSAGMIYILAMRFAAQGFIKLLARFPGLETAAFVAVMLIGLKLCVELPGDVLGLVKPGPQVAMMHAHPVPSETTAPSAVAEAPSAVYEAPSASTAHTATGARFAQYKLAAARVRGEQLVLHIPWCLEVSAASLSEPVASDFATPRDHREARSHWNLHLRPLVHIEPAGTAMVILMVFALGFLRRKKPDQAA